jgi:hypothetical protein
MLRGPHFVLLQAVWLLASFPHGTCSLSVFCHAT